VRTPRLSHELLAVVPRFVEDQGFLLAAALSFACRLCLAPLTLILFSVAGFLLESDEIAEYLFDAAYVALPAYGREVAEFLGLLVRERAVTGVVGILSWAVLATPVFTLTRLVLNRAFRLPVGRPWVRGFAVDLFAVATLGSLAVGLTLGLVLLAGLGDVLARLVSLPALSSAALRRLFALPLVYAGALALLFFVYRTLPNARVPARAAATATLAVAVAWEAARWVFGAYVGMFGTFGRLYGSIGIGIATLVWIYYSAAIFVAGAELAAVVTERRALTGTSAAACGR